MWFQSWSDLLRVLLVGTAGYAAVVVLLRVTGKRTLAKLNAFDLVVTVALGSTLATILLSADVSWSEGALALALLAGGSRRTHPLQLQTSLVERSSTAPPRPA